MRPTPRPLLSSPLLDAPRLRASRVRRSLRAAAAAAVCLAGLAGCSATATVGPAQLFDGSSLEGWHADVPAADGDPDVLPSFVARDGMLVSLGEPRGHLITDDSFADYRLEVEYRWPGATGNCGVLVHASTPRYLYGMFPRSLEVQLQHGSAGDFWCIGEDVTVPDMASRRSGDPSTWGGEEGQSRQIVNLTDGSERAPGEWNVLAVECRGNAIDVWVNGDRVNGGTDCTADAGRIAIQAEGAEVEFRRIELLPLPDAD
ncbi:MAG: DUF1080 domain-containing protein [Planctomycetota bacterium]